MSYCCPRNGEGDPQGQTALPYSDGREKTSVGQHSNLVVLSLSLQTEMPTKIVMQSRIEGEG